MKAPSLVQAFASEARLFSDWAIGTDASPMTPRDALTRLTALYAAALNLPPPWTEGLEAETPDVELPPGSVEAVTRRAFALPVGVYWLVFDPMEDPPPEPVCGHIIDDIGDVFRDVARGLVLLRCWTMRRGVMGVGIQFPYPLGGARYGSDQSPALLAGTGGLEWVVE